MSADSNQPRPSGGPCEEPDEIIRDLRVRVGLLQSELEQLRREHAALKSTLAQDIAMLARRYLEPARHPATSVRNVDGVIFGGWDQLHREPRSDAPVPSPSRDTRSA